jgi:cytochrome c-type biogenesis protein CcmF
MLRQKNYTFGGYLAHVGFGLMLVGMITSSVYDKSEKVTLPKDEVVQVLGYNVQYKGKQASADGKDKVIISINGKSDTYANFYWSDYSRAYMVAPSVINKILHDLYISPIQIIPAGENRPESDKIILKKGDTIPFQNYSLRFTGYDLGNHEMGGGEMMITALIEIWQESEENKQLIKPAIFVKGNDRNLRSAGFMDTGREVFISGINVESNSISISITKEANNSNDTVSKEILAAEVSIKPLISILWIGTIILIAGFFVSLFNRSLNQ